MKNTQTSSFGVSARIGHNSTKFYNSKLYRNLEISKQDKQKENILEEKNLIKSFIIVVKICLNFQNVSKDYDKNLSLNEYLELLKNVFAETHRVLVNGGRACINIANIGRKPYIPLTMYVNQIMLELGFLMLGEIIWDKSASSGISFAWGSFKSASNPVLRDTHEYILIFSKGEFKREKKMNGKGVKQDSISKENFMEWSKSIWRFPATSAKKIGHPAPFP